uniref:Cytochrome P450 71A1 n=1 Tax=Cajanus cajan TaxID=3821 RepID=A0A151QWS3_CAJCA|nr:Cytochrome P450 71A1 [Cajanus cajan]
MKEAFSSTLYLSLSFFISVLLLFKLIRRTKSKTKLNLPPSPPKLPIIGNLHQFGELPHRSLRDLSLKYGDMMMMQMGRQTPTLVVSSADVVREIMKTHDIAFSDRVHTTAAKLCLYDCTGIGFGLYDENWREKKKVCVQHFLSTKVVESFRLIRGEEVAELVNKLREASSADARSVNLRELLLSTPMKILYKCVFGRNYSEHNYNKVVDSIRKVLVHLVAFTVRDQFPLLGWIDVLTGKIREYKTTFEELDAALDEAIAEQITAKTNSKEKDFVDILLQLQEDNTLNIEFTKNDIKGLITVTLPVPLLFSHSFFNLFHKQTNSLITQKNPLHFKLFQHFLETVMALASSDSASNLSVLCVSLSVALGFLVFKIRRRRSKSNAPPSPPKLPFIGNLHQLGTLPHRSLQALSRNYGPLMMLHMGHIPTLIVSSAHVASEILKNHDAFQFIRAEEVAEMIAAIREACASGSSCVHLSELLIALTNNTLSRCVFGQKYDSPDGSRSFGVIRRKLLSQFTAFCVGDFFPSLSWVDVLTGRIRKLKATLSSLDVFFDQVIAEHKTKMKKKGEDDGQPDKKDFVDKDGFKLRTATCIAAAILLLRPWASDTTSTTLEWAMMAELMKNPNTMEKVQEEVRRVVENKAEVDENDVKQMNYSKCVVKETLRLHPP